MSWASRRLCLLAALAFLAGACHFKRAALFQSPRARDSMPLGAWKVVALLNDNTRTLAPVPPAALMQLGRSYFFGPDYLRYPEGVQDLQCAHGGYGLYRRRIAQEEIFDRGQNPSFDPREAGIRDKQIYEVKTLCGPAFYLSLDKSCILLPKDGVLQVLRREHGPLKPDPTATPTPAPRPTPRPFTTPLDFHPPKPPKG